MERMTQLPAAEGLFYFPTRPGRVSHRVARGSCGHQAPTLSAGRPYGFVREKTGREGDPRIAPTAFALCEAAVETGEEGKRHHVGERGFEADLDRLTRESQNEKSND